MRPNVAGGAIFVLQACSEQVLPAFGGATADAAAAPARDFWTLWRRRGFFWRAQTVACGATGR